MPPGQIALTRRDFPVNSIAIARVSPMSPCLAAQYPAEYACPSSPAIEETLTMLPPRSSKCGSAARERKNGPFRLTARSCAHSESAISAV